MIINYNGFANLIGNFAKVHEKISIRKNFFLNKTEKERIEISINELQGYMARAFLQLIEI